MTDRKRIYQYLVDQAMDVGFNTVKEACGDFLKNGLKIFAEPQRRIAVPRHMVKAAWQKQGGRCKRCSKPLALDEAEGDHVIAHSLGGELKQSNIVALHGKRSEFNCNASKGDKDLYTESKRSGNFMNEMFNENEVTDDQSD